MLWFVMMLMPTGPSAMKVMVLADVADAEHKDKMVIAKFLAVSAHSKCQDTKLTYSQVIYAISPLMTLTVIGGLKACNAAM